MGEGKCLPEQRAFCWGGLLSFSRVEKEYVCVVVLRKRQEINKLYVHEVTQKEKLLAGSSNPTQSLAARQGDIVKVLGKIISAKSDWKNFMPEF
jgi:hypothetical protein